MLVILTWRPHRGKMNERASAGAQSPSYKSQIARDPLSPLCPSLLVLLLLLLLILPLDPGIRRLVVAPLLMLLLLLPLLEKVLLVRDKDLERHHIVLQPLLRVGEKCRLCPQGTHAAADRVHVE